MIRHAKSSWADPGQADFDRPLDERGLKDGNRLVRWMTALQERPVFICSSDAARARATAELVRAGSDLPKTALVFEHRIYEASTTTLLDVVHGLPDNCPSAALVGHNPGFTEFVNQMVGEAVIDNLPTLGIAILDLGVGFAAARFGCAQLVQLHSPKSLRK